MHAILARLKRVKNNKNHQTKDPKSLYSVDYARMIGVAVVLIGRGLAALIVHCVAVEETLAVAIVIDGR